MLSRVRPSISLFLALTLVAWVLVGVAIPSERESLAAAPGGTPEIMLVGDSITNGGWGSPDDTGFRRYLSLSLEATHGSGSFDFVGSLSGPVPPTDYDPEHNGIGGERADEVRDKIVGYLNATPADIIALHIGTNDIGGQSAVGVAGEIAEILDEIDTWEASNHPVWVVLSKIINRESYSSDTADLNVLIQSLADARIAAGDLVYVVDMEAALDYTEDMDDNLHPDDSGYVKMAAVYDEAIDLLLDAGLTPLVENVTLSSTSGSGLPSDDLSCAFDLSGAATTAAAVWSLDGSPFATLALPMEGGAVSALVDYSGNGNDAVIAGDAVWSATAGHDGNGAFEFDGTGDYLDAGAVFPVGSSYTKTAWVYRAGDGVANHHLNIMSSDEQDGSGPSVEHVLWAPGGYGFELAAGHGTNREVVRDSVALATGQWYHVAVTWDSVSGDMVLYKNGVPVDTGITTDVVNQAAVQVGGFDEQYVWQGTIDDARVYPVALSADQIAAMYNGGAGDSNTVVAAETTIDDDWQCQVTPFSDTEAGATVASNTVAITDGGTPVFAVTYDGNTNTGGTAPVDGASPYESGATVTVLAAGDLVKSGFMFDGWNTAANGSGIDYAPAATFAITADTTLYAQWLSDGSGPLVENVTLSSTSGSGLPSDDLSCAFDLSGAATTAAAVWSLDGSPFATLALPMEGGATAALEDVSGNSNDVAMFDDPTWSATAGHDGKWRVRVRRR